MCIRRENDRQPTNKTMRRVPISYSPGIAAINLHLPLLPQRTVLLGLRGGSWHMLLCKSFLPVGFYFIYFKTKIEKRTGSTHLRLEKLYIAPEFVWHGGKKACRPFHLLGYRGGGSRARPRFFNILLVRPAASASDVHAWHFTLGRLFRVQRASRRRSLGFTLSTSLLAYRR